MENKKIWHGAVLKLTRYDTEQTVRQNLAQMVENGLDTVVIWPAVYWWEEKKPGYPFNTGRQVLEIAREVGIRVVMELAGQLPMMEAIPDFQMKEEYFCTDEHGNKRLPFNSFGWLNYFHPEVDRLICDNYRQTAEAYKGYPALAAYDVFNETAFNSFDKYTMAQFRQWLQRKYGTIENLNDAWERSFTDFSQIYYSPWVWMSILPEADMGAFRKEAVGIFLQRWCDAIRQVDDRHPLIADNIGSMITSWPGSYDRPQDDFVLAEAADEIGMSFYPKQVSGCNPPHIRWTTLDGFFAASKGRGYYISEMQAHIQALFNPSTAVASWELKQWCCESLASGIKGLIYWMWRPFEKGLQTGGRGLVDHKNRSTPRLEFVKQFSETLDTVGHLMPVKSPVGLVFDGRCHDFQVCYTKNYKVDKTIYPNAVRGAYKALFDAGLRPDIITLDRISDYKVVILTNQLVMDEETARRLRQFVVDGGVILCDGKIGVVDACAKLNSELPGGQFRDMMGIDYIDSDMGDMNFGKDLCGSYGRELVQVTDAKVLESFADGWPAVVEKVTGKGRVITVNCQLWHGAMTGEGSADVFARKLAEHYAQVMVTGSLKVRVAQSEQGRFAFVFNYTDEPVQGHLRGLGFDCPVQVEANDVVIIKGDVL